MRLCGNQPVRASILRRVADLNLLIVAASIRYGASSKTIGGWQGKAGFLRRVAEALDLPSTLMIVAASMGGSYALPFVHGPGALQDRRLRDGGGPAVATQRQAPVGPGARHLWVRGPAAPRFR